MQSELVSLLKNPKNCQVAVVGEGISGRSANKLLTSLGANTTVLDEKDGTELKEDAVLGFDFVVLSPGFPRAKLAIQCALKNKIPVVNEIDLACVHLGSCRFIGITGTNGKSTTVAMIGDVLMEVDPCAFVGGNFGKPLCDAILSNENPRFGVLELSSYQLETLCALRLDVALVTNLSEDHLDRYLNQEHYYKTKEKIFSLLKTDGVALINGKDLLSQRYLKPCEARDFNLGFPFSIPNMIGAHIKDNVAAAYAACQALGISDGVIESAINRFKGIAHRLEYLGDVQGVGWYNDSKATNIESAMAAIKSFDKGIHLVLGGQGKGQSYDALVSVCKNRVKKIYAIGAEAEKIRDAFNGKIPLTCVGTLDRAIHDAHLNARKGDVILLAPACASFDQYSNYSARGEHLKHLFIAHGGRSDDK